MFVIIQYISGQLFVITTKRNAIYSYNFNVLCREPHAHTQYINSPVISMYQVCCHHRSKTYHIFYYIFFCHIFYSLLFNWATLSLWDQLNNIRAIVLGWFHLFCSWKKKHFNKIYFRFFCCRLPKNKNKIITRIDLNLIFLKSQKYKSSCIFQRFSSHFSRWNSIFRHISICFFYIIIIIIFIIAISIARIFFVMTAYAYGGPGYF